MSLQPPFLYTVVCGPRSGVRPKRGGERYEVYESGLTDGNNSFFSCSWSWFEDQPHAPDHIHMRSK